MIPGHTKFICDRYFGFLKARYKKSVINTVDDVAEVTRTSAHGNNAVHYKDHEWKYFDFINYLLLTLKESPTLDVTIISRSDPLNLASLLPGNC